MHDQATPARERHGRTASPDRFPRHRQLLTFWQQWGSISLYDLRDEVNDQAACRDDWSAMYPEPDDEAGLAEARAVCATCPVPGPCLVLALRLHEDEYGVWGGLSPAERRAARGVLGHAWPRNEEVA